MDPRFIHLYLLAWLLKPTFCSVPARRCLHVTTKGEVHGLVQFRNETHVDLTPDRCTDCGVAEGGTHHPCWDIEESPVCAGQTISFRCAEPTCNAMLTE